MGRHKARPRERYNTTPLNVSKTLPNVAHTAGTWRHAWELTSVLAAVTAEVFVTLAQPEPVVQPKRAPEQKPEDLSKADEKLSSLLGGKK